MARVLIPSIVSEVKIMTDVTGWDKSLHLLRIFGLLGWNATTKFTRPVMEICKSNLKGYFTSLLYRVVIKTVIN